MQRFGRRLRWGAWASLVALAACSSGGGSQTGDNSSSTTSDRRSTTTRPTSDTTSAPGQGGTTAPPTTRPGGDGGASGDWWRPKNGLTWQWQLVGTIDQSVEADVYDVDLFETPASTVQQLHDKGRKVICYFSAGSWEPYRPDAGDFPASVKGPAVEGWPDERWLDVRQIDVLRPLMAARFDLCAEKGFDGVEPDWMDNHTQDTSFGITAAEQLAYNRMLAEMAHERGLAIGLKNDLDQVAELADLFDYAVVESCFEYDECHMLRPFVERDKPVFEAEYDKDPSEFCAQARELGLSSIRKHLDLDPWRKTC